jgi:hypothetical protein
MYRNYRQLRDGWTKNLALLFPRPGRLALKVLALWALFWIVLVMVNARWAKRWWNGIDFAILVWLLLRLRPGNFRSGRNLLGALFGMPMFAYLLLRSKRAHAKGTIPWKGRTYSDKGGLLAPGATNP